MSDLAGQSLPYKGDCGNERRTTGSAKNIAYKIRIIRKEWTNFSLHLQIVANSGLGCGFSPSINIECKTVFRLIAELD